VAFTSPVLPPPANPKDSPFMWTGCVLELVIDQGLLEQVR